jgi:hypothetical protein
MSKLLRRVACLTLASTLFVVPASTQAQTMVETCRVTGNAAAGAAALASSDGNSGDGQVAGPAGMFGAMGTGVVEALGGDSAEVTEAVRAQQQRERDILAPFTSMVAIGGC